MTTEITTDNVAIAEFVLPRADMKGRTADEFTAIGIKRNGVLSGGVLYENYTGPGGCVEMHVAGDGARWMTPQFLRLVFGYPFIQLGCKVVRGRVPSNNIHALAFDLRLGFTIEHLIRNARPDGDDWLLMMWRDNCRFLEK